MTLITQSLIDALDSPTTTPAQVKSVLLQMFAKVNGGMTSADCIDELQVPLQKMSARYSMVPIVFRRDALTSTYTFDSVIAPMKLPNNIPPIIITGGTVVAKTSLAGGLVAPFCRGKQLIKEVTVAATATVYEFEPFFADWTHDDILEMRVVTSSGAQDFSGHVTMILHGKCPLIVGPDV